MKLLTVIGKGLSVFLFSAFFRVIEEKQEPAHSGGGGIVRLFVFEQGGFICRQGNKKVKVNHKHIG